MTVRVNKDSFNLREKLSELERPIGMKGADLMKSETSQDARDLVSAGRKNLIINGDMKISQRTTFTNNVTTSAYRCCDRFRQLISSLGTWTIEQHPNAADGFNNSFKTTCTSADASPAANDNTFLVYQIEAQDAQCLAYGTPNAKDSTLSFWVRSNVTGDASFTVLQNDNSNKLASFKYTINSADTWEYKTITIPGDPAGVINDDNGEGLQLEWWLDGGSTYTGGSSTGWSTFSNSNRNHSNLGLGRVFDNYFQITGIQLEVGKNATDFEYRSYGEELALCQRYYWKTEDFLWLYSLDVNHSYVRCNIFHPVEMRAAPTVTGSFNNSGSSSGFQGINKKHTIPFVNGPGAALIDLTAGAEFNAEL